MRQKTLTNEFKVRLTAIQTEQLKALASSCGMSAADYIRRKVFSGKFDPKTADALRTAYFALADAARKLASLGNLLLKGEYGELTDLRELAKKDHLAVKRALADLKERL